LFVANFVGSPGMNFVAGDNPLAKTMGIRCEHVRVVERGGVEGIVEVDEYLGAFRFVHVKTAVGKLIMRAPEGGRRAMGERVMIGFDPEHVNYFDDAGKR